MSSNSPASLGVQAKAGFGAANPVTQALELGPGGDQLKAQRNRVQTDGLRGTRQRIHETTGDGMIQIAGDVEIIPVATVLAAMLPNILGGTPTGSGPKTYPFAEVLPTFYWSSSRVANVFTYAGCKVNKAVFSASQGQALKCVLSLCAQTETQAAAGSFPSIVVPTDSPFMWSTGIYTFNSVAREVKDCTITIDNHLITDRFNNSQTATQFPESDLEITIEATLPFTADELDLYGVGLNADIGGTIAFTDTDATTGPGAVAPHTLTFTFSKLDWASVTPVVADRNEIHSKVKFVARKQTAGTPADAISISM